MPLQYHKQNRTDIPCIDSIDLLTLICPHIEHSTSGITFRLGNAQEEFADAPVYTALRLPNHTQKTEYSYDWKVVVRGGGGEEKSQTLT